MGKEEAMKILKDFHDKSALFSVRTALDTIIPELKESEDEKVRKTLIEYFNAYPKDYFGGLKKSYILAWLEKQGCQKSVDKEYTFKSIPRLLDMIESTDRAKSYCQKLIDSLLKEGYTTDAKIVSDCLKQMNGEKVAMAVIDIEKQVEQPRYSIGDVLCDKSCTTLNKDAQPNFEIIDIRDGMYICDKGSFPISQQDEYELVAKKIVPKFQNGQWIVWQNKCYKVNYNGCGYELIDQNGLSTSLEYGTIDGSAHLWDVAKDAKDGDVLASKDKEDILIYKSHSVIDLLLTSHISFSKKEGFCPRQYSAWDSNEFIPATKEQRDLLFQKMHEAGYEWSEETHELKKISQRMVSAEAKEALYDKPTDEEMKELLRTEYEKGRADTLSETKSSWSEEDEKRLKSCLNILQPKTLLGNVETINTKWLKSLKQRIGG